MDFVYLFFLGHHIVREEKNLKLQTYGSGGLRDFYTHNVFSAAMAFSDDGSLFAYCDGSK